MCSIFQYKGGGAFCEWRHHLLFHGFIDLGLVPLCSDMCQRKRISQNTFLKNQHRPLPGLQNFAIS